MTQDMVRWMFQEQLKRIHILLFLDAWLYNISAGWCSVLLHPCNFSDYFYWLLREECWTPTPALQLYRGFVYSRTREILLELSLYASCLLLLLVSGCLASRLEDTEVKWETRLQFGGASSFVFFSFNLPDATYFSKSSNRCSVHSIKILWLHSVGDTGWNVLSLPCGRGHCSVFTQENVCSKKVCSYVHSSLMYSGQKLETVHCLMNNCSIIIQWNIT